MKQLPISVTNKKGEAVEAVLMIPETVPEMVNIMGAKFVLATMTREYVRREKRRLASGWKPREKILRFKESALTPEQKAILTSAGLLPVE